MSARADRRTFLKRGLAMGGALAVAPRFAVPGLGPGIGVRGQLQPNILVVVVDQMRTPQWFPPDLVARNLPNIDRLRRESVSFERHYTASNDCSPARSVMVTGLYSHQTGCLITGRSTLNPGFPTWGTMLREHGYQTMWRGKWHLSQRGSLEPYGFDGTAAHHDNGGPGQGLRRDPQIAREFESWFRANANNGPWCATVSFINPHDIAWWYNRTDRFRDERGAPRAFADLPPNFETPDQLIARGKPRLQRALQDSAAINFGAVPFRGPRAHRSWTGFLDLYLKLQSYVDAQVGRVLATLAAHPAVAANTVVVFTADHGEYGGSHGLRGKGAGAYEEAIRVPLYVKDPRGQLTSDNGTPRQQLTSSADLAAFLLTIARGSNGWRQESRYSQIASRLDLAAICGDASAQGRDWIVHATDEVATEYAAQHYADNAPLHVIALRTRTAKYATYSNWNRFTHQIEEAGQETELYEYDTYAGQLELANVAGRSAAEPGLRQTLENQAIPGELRAALPDRLRGAQHAGYANYKKARSRHGHRHRHQRHVRLA